MWGYFCVGFIDFMFTGKTLTDFPNIFSPNNFNKNDDIVLKYFLTNVSNITECNSHGTHKIYPYLNSFSLNVVQLNDQQHFRLNNISEFKDYLFAEIKERELMNKRLSK